MIETPAPQLFLVAGEQSGDLLGGRLMARLREQTGDRISFAGIGGETMIEQGLSPLFPMTDLSVMGISEVLPRLPLLIRRIRETATEVIRSQPAALVTIDAPDFSFRVARKVHAAGIPCIHYVAPSVWVWRKGRAAKIARFLDHLLALLPFEPPYFEKVGLPCSFVGHPAIEGGAGAGDGGAFRARHGIAADARVVAMLPGSRSGEISRLLPIFCEVLRRVQAGRAPLYVVVPTIAHAAAQIRAGLTAAGFDALLVEGEAEKFDAFAAADVALAKSGTVILELALSGVPTVLCYAVSGISYAIAIRMANLRYAGLPNLVLDRPLMPEFLQDECRPEPIANAMARLLDDSAARQIQVEGMAEVRRRLSPPDVTPSEAAAATILKVIAERRNR